MQYPRWTGPALPARALTDCFSDSWNDTTSETVHNLKTEFKTAEFCLNMIWTVFTPYAFRKDELRKFFSFIH